MKRTTGRSKKEIVRTESERVRLTAQERESLQNLADQMGIQRSKIIRRLIREAVNTGPDFFDDGIKELRESNRQLAAIGRNLNRLLKLIEIDKPINGRDLEGEYENLLSGYEEMREAYQVLMLKSKNRIVVGAGA